MSIEINSFMELEVTITADYQPFEAQTKTDPEVPADIEYLYVWLKGVDITNQLSAVELEWAKQQCWDYIAEGEEE